MLLEITVASFIATGSAVGANQETTIQTPYGFGEIKATQQVAQGPVPEVFVGHSYVLPPFECTSFYEPRKAIVKYIINTGTEKRFVYDCSFNGSDSAGGGDGDGGDGGE